MQLSICCYQHYDYEDGDPLLFVKLPQPLTAIQKVALCKAVEIMYGDTEQDTPEWALEFQLWIRMLIHDECLCLNPRKLHFSNGEHAALLSLLDGENRYAYEAALSKGASEQIAEWLSMKEGDDDMTLLITPSLPAAEENIRYRVADENSNAARSRGQKVEQVAIKRGSKYLTDVQGNRYSMAVENVDENGNTYFVNYVPEYSPDYRLYATAAAAEDYLRRIAYRDKVCGADFTELPLSKLADIVSIIE